MALHPRELKLGEALVRLKLIDEQFAPAVASAGESGQRLNDSLLRLRLVQALMKLPARGGA